MSVEASCFAPLCRSFRWFVSPLVCLSVLPSVGLSIGLSIHPSIRLSSEWSFRPGGHCHATVLSISKIIHPLFIISTGIIFNLVTLPVIFRVYVKNLKRLGTEGQQNSLWLLLTTLAISDTLEIIIYLSSYSLLHRSPESDYVVGFYIPNQRWYED